MTTDKLIKMANQIGAFFEAMPDRSQAMLDIATHIQKNWDPQMRAALLVRLDAGTEGLTPIVRDAVKAHRKGLEPLLPSSSPT